MKRLGIVLVITIVFGFFGLAQAQTTWDVGGGNNNFATLADALASVMVVDDDILEIYVDQIADHVSSKRITIRSANPGTPVDINRITLADGSSGSTLEDLVLSNSGGVGSDRTILLENPGIPVSATVTRCTITSDLFGILVLGGTLDITESSISGGTYGIGQDFPGGVINMTDTTINGSSDAGLYIGDISTVTGTGTNTVNGANKGVVLSAIDSGTLTISGITFTGSLVYGAHIVSANSNAQIDIINCDFVNGLENGLAIETSNASVYIRGCAISNHEESGPDIGGGAGIFSGMENVSLVIEDSVFNDNRLVALITGDQASNTVEIRRTTFSCPSFYIDDPMAVQAHGLFSTGLGNILVEDNCSFTDLNVAVTVWEADTSIENASFERNGTALSTSGMNITTTGCSFANTNQRSITAGLVSLTDSSVYVDNGSTFQAPINFEFRSINTFNSSNIQTTTFVTSRAMRCETNMNDCIFSGSNQIQIQDYTSPPRPDIAHVTLNNCQMETSNRFIQVNGEGTVTINGGTFTNACGDVMLNVQHELGVISLNGAGDSLAEKLDISPVISGGTIIVGRAAAGAISLTNVTASQMPPGFLESWSDAGQGSLLGNVSIEYDQCSFLNGSGCYNANLNGTVPSSYTITVNALNTVWTTCLSQQRIIGINAQDGLIANAAVNLEHCTLTATGNVHVDGNISFDSSTAVTGRDTLTAQYCIFDAAGASAASGTIALSGNGNLIAPGTVGSGDFLSGQPGDTIITANAGVNRNTGLLESGSQAINNATGSPATVDFRGVPRPYGSAADIGAHELYAMPVAPVNLAATAHFDDYVTLYWTDSSGTETGFAVERRIGAGAWEEVATVGADSETWQDDDVIAATTYTYRVRAYNAGQSSEYSNEAAATTSAGTGLEVAVVGSTLVEVVVENYVELEVAVQGATGVVTYQWYYDDGIHGPVAVTGAEDALLVIATASYDNDGAYWCDVTDELETVSSAQITLLVVVGMPVTCVTVVLLLSIIILAGSFAVSRKQKVELNG